MMDFVKDRTLQANQKVKVYLNLNMMGRFSIQDYKSGLVVGYADSVLLKDVEMKISLSGQKRARDEKRRNVHAVAVGNFISADIDRPEDLKNRGYYNPFMVDTFVDEETQQPIFMAGMVYCGERRIFYRRAGALIENEQLVIGL